MRDDIEFKTEDGTTLCGWLYRPKETPSDGVPIVVMAHGFSGVKGSLTKYAETFCEAGLAVLLYDHRGYGDSGGDVRLEIVPHQQVADFRDAITFARTLKGIDPERVGIWGSSYAGGHCINIAANDRRVKCVVAQIPIIAGHFMFKRMFQADRQAELRKMFAADRENRLVGGEPARIPVFSTGDDICCLPPKVSKRFIEASEDEDPNWRNEATLRSLEHLGEYEPGALISHVSPTPLLMVVALKDVLTPPEYALEAFERALEPKRLVAVVGGHFSVYYQHLEKSRGEARDWFVKYLITEPAALKQADVKIVQRASAQKAT